MRVRCVSRPPLCVRLVYNIEKRGSGVDDDGVSHTAERSNYDAAPPPAPPRQPRPPPPRRIARCYLFLYARTAETGFGTHCVWVTRGRQTKTGARGGGCISDVFNARRPRVFARAILQRDDEGTARRTFFEKYLLPRTKATI